MSTYFRRFNVCVLPLAFLAAIATCLELGITMPVCGQWRIQKVSNEGRTPEMFVGVVHFWPKTA